MHFDPNMLGSTFLVSQPTTAERNGRKRRMDENPTPAQEASNQVDVLTDHVAQLHLSPNSPNPAQVLEHAWKRPRNLERALEMVQQLMNIRV